MTNQMRKIVRAIFFSVLFANVLFVVLFFVGTLGFSSWVSFFALGINVASSIWLGLFLLEDKKTEKYFLTKLKTAKDIIRQRNEILSHFYRQSNIPLQYDKNGNIRDIDSILGIAPEYDKDGNLLPTIYEILMIKPLIDENGREIPTVLVVKHLVSRFKTENLEKIAEMKFVRKSDEDEILNEKLNTVVDKKKVVEKKIDAVKKNESSDKKTKFAKYSPGKAVLFNYKTQPQKASGTIDSVRLKDNQKVSPVTINYVGQNQERPIPQQQSANVYRRSGSSFLREANTSNENQQYVYPEVKKTPKADESEDEAKGKGREWE